MVSSTAVSSVPAVREAVEPVVGAARYGAVQALMDSLLHDVRNPLNALAINLEVLTEKLRLETGQVPPSQEKNLRAMREQIQRVDGLLRQFAEFIVFRGGTAGEASLSEVARRSLEVLAHESRRRRLTVRTAIEPGVQVRLADTGELGFFLVQALLRAFGRSEVDGEVSVSVRAEGGLAVLEVSDTAGPSVEPSSDAVAALELRCAQLGVEFQVRGGSCRLRFPRA